MILLVIVAILYCLVLRAVREPVMLTSLKQRYETLRNNLGTDPRWMHLKRQAILTGLMNKSRKSGAIGYNVNKGYEIYICLDGDDVNSAMHVLIHELAHTSVTEYDHTSTFWKNFKDLKQVAVAAGVYQEVGKHAYCGETFGD
jgi:hypothetical protein